MDQSGSYQIMLELEATVNADGSYLFTGVDVPPERAFLVVTNFEEIQYQSDPMIVTNGITDYSIPITVYDRTEDFDQLSFSQVHLIFDQPSMDEIQVTELFIVKNPGSHAVFVSSDGNSIPFILTPENAGSVKYQLSQGSSQPQNATGGFAMVPGTEEQYGFVAGYSLPYQRKLKFDQSFSLPVASLTVFIPDGMRLRGEQLTEAGTQDIQGQSYQMYQANNMASGISLLLTLSGKPGISDGFPLDKETIILIGICAVGVLLIGVAIYLYLRDRDRFRKEIENDNQEVGQDVLWDDRDSILDALIALDDQYKAGEIPKPAYETRRRELKKRLKQTL